MGDFHGVRFTFVDRDAQEFVPCGGAGWDTRAEARQEFDALPSTDGGDFLADFWADDMHEDDKRVTVETIEAKMGDTIDDLIAEGRRQLAEERAEIRRRLRPIPNTGG